MAQRFPEDGIDFVDSTGRKPFTPKQILNLSNAALNGDRMTIADTDQLLGTKPALVPRFRDRLASTVLPVMGVVAAAGGMKLGLHLNPDLTEIGKLPEAVHYGLNTIGWDHIPFANMNTENRGALNHIPPALNFGAVWGGVVYAAARTLQGSPEAQHQKALPILQEKVTKGENWWDTKNTPNSILAYMDGPLSIPETIGKALAIRTVVMTHHLGMPGATVVYPEKHTYRRALDAFRQAGAPYVNHALILPGSTYDIFPDLEAARTFSIGVPRIVRFITQMDDQRGNDTLPVTIIGAKNQPFNIAVATSADRPKDEFYPGTLETRMKLLQATRKGPITIIDPTEEVLGEIFAKVEDSPLKLVGEPDSNVHYATAFYAAAEARQHLDPRAKPVDVIFGRSDNMSTVVLPRPGVKSLYVFQDEASSDLVPNGLPKSSNVITVAGVLANRLRQCIPTLPPAIPAKR